MADSNITKKALALALKDIMQEKPFEKINVSDICEKCDMNRKSFYYHFKDKYDLVNWIFDTEFVAAFSQAEYESKWRLLTDILEYFYDNHDFYRKVLAFSGQNSFADHLREIISPLLMQRFATLFPNEDGWKFQVAILCDVFILPLYRWIMEKEPMTVEAFISQGKYGITYIAHLIEKIDQEIE